MHISLKLAYYSNGSSSINGSVKNIAIVCL